MYIRLEIIPTRYIKHLSYQVSTETINIQGNQTTYHVVRSIRWLSQCVFFGIISTLSKYMYYTLARLKEILLAQVSETASM